MNHIEQNGDAVNVACPLAAAPVAAGTAAVEFWVLFSSVLLLFCEQLLLLLLLLLLVVLLLLLPFL